ncbi:unnamed protein product [Peniophora sp. CBMAI 1063]|nr:unnamed protein product [Peniophora sp. CBMAI 1063]
MWWLDPGKEVLNAVFNRILAPYVENLDMNQVNYGIGQGQLTLRKLRLKKGALDKFNLPVEVVEGHLGTFTLSLHWRNLGNQPVEVLIEDVYLLVVPAPTGEEDPEEEEKREQAVKSEKLENAEILHMRSQTEVKDDPPQQQGLIASLIAKIVNNLQVTIKNIHVRYEDKLSVPDHPFAAGLTLASLTAFSVNDQWQPAFIESTAGRVHKLSNLDSLAVYFDTDAKSILGLPYQESIDTFHTMIARTDSTTSHQFILQPVSGEGRIVMNNHPDNDNPRFDVEILFDSIGVVLDDHQYRDAISLVDMFHFYRRQHQYRKLRPTPEEMEESRPRALLKFAGRAVLDGVHEKNRQWTWAHFAERRDDRHAYVDLFKKKQLNAGTPQDANQLAALEKKLSYEDIRFYRSIARSQLRKDKALRDRLEKEKQQAQGQQQSSGWGGWLWGSSSTKPAQEDESSFHGPMTEQQKKELYDVLDFDEKTALANSFEAPREQIKMRVAAQLKKGSFALKSDPHGSATDILAIVFDGMAATYLQRRDNMEVTASLGSFGISDNTTPGSLYPQIVQVKTEVTGAPDDKPFFYVKFENNPLDERADMGVLVRMRHMEIIYHKGYVEAVYRFFKPPESQLESVEALLSAASETLEGLRKETRAGLEYALQTHKTVDLQVDMNAPIIIIPESVSIPKCTHLVIDAGHIAVESDLADKDAVQEVYNKRNQQYTDEDQARLESLMYDKFFVRLQAAQFVIGEDLGSCRHALTSPDSSKSHLLERINIDLQLQKCIVSTAATLSRIKVAGSLPALKVNFSDAKYKSLLRLIDVTIPHFGDDKPSPQSNLRLPPGFFGDTGKEYHLDDEVQSENGDDDQNVEASQSTDAGILQKTFELDFRVDILSASIAKKQGDDEKALGSLSFNKFGLAFAMTEMDMKVDVRLGSLSMELVDVGPEPLEVLSSADVEGGHADSVDLLTVGYTRVQQKIPELLSPYDGADQNVDMKISTVIVRLSPEAILTLYDFLMTTFVPSTGTDSGAAAPTLETEEVTSPGAAAKDDQATGKIRVSIKLASVKVILINVSSRLATLALSTATTTVIVIPGGLDVQAHLGSLSLSDDSPQQTSLPQFKHLLSIEGDSLAEIRYQTFNPSEVDRRHGVKSAVELTAGSLKLHYLERPLHDLYVFLSKLAKLKGLYDSATQVAVQRASEIEKMQLKLDISTPIIVLPADPVTSHDILTMQLGAISLDKSYTNTHSNMDASLRGLKLTSTLGASEGSFTLKMIDDIEIVAKVVAPLVPPQDSSQPETQVSVTISDVKLSLTERQYQMILDLSLSVPRILAGAPKGAAQADSSAGTPQRIASGTDIPAEVGLNPELTVTSSAVRTSMDVIVTANSIQLNLYGRGATDEASLRQNGLARFALTGSDVRVKMMSDGAMECQIILKAFTMGDTRPGAKFREVIPAAKHQRNQLMVLYTSSGGPKPASLAVVTVDAPHIILAVELVFGLLAFLTSPFKSKDETTEPVTAEKIDDAPSESSGMDFRFDMHDVLISVLEDDQDMNSQAVRLHVGQISMSQQGVLALTVDKLGMSLTRMGKGAEEVRFLDDLDLTLSMDNKMTADQTMTSIEISCKPVVLRASYRDILLILAITHKATVAYAQQAASPRSPTDVSSSARSLPSSRPNAMTRYSSRGTQQSSRPLGRAHVSLSSESLKASLDGLKLILIGDLHEQPMVSVQSRPFRVGAKDWSGALDVSTTIAMSIDYWNLSNSHWEPLIDPWTFTAGVGRPDASGAMNLSLTSRERLNLNISTTSVEIALDMLKVMSQQGDRVMATARGSYAPYRIRNRTGTDLFVWSDVEGAEKTDANAAKLTNGQTTDWRFDDWRTMREHTPSREHSIAIQFVGQPWEQLRSIPVDREGEYTFSLRPRTEAIYSRMLCEVKVESGVKIITLRSTYRIRNQTLYPVEIGLSDEDGRTKHDVFKLAPGHDYPLPIETVGKCKVRIQPDSGFGYKWSTGLRWNDLISHQSFTLRCPHTDQGEAAFRFHAFVKTDTITQPLRRYPKIDLSLRAPIELENLLPYNLQYRIYDKDTDQNWRSYLRKGGVMPVHSVELGHLVLLNVEIQDTQFKPSDFSIINTDGHSDFDIEKRVTVQDAKGRKLDLALNYVKHADAGGAFKVQIYCPYLVVNKTGLPFGIRSVRTNRASGPQDVAGDTRPEVLSSNAPFLLSHPSEHGKDFVLKLGDSGWSKTLSLDAPAADTELTIPAEKSQEVHVGLSWTEALGKYKLTKVITLCPRFFVKNDLPSATLCVREHGVAPKGRSELKPGERIPLFAMRVGFEKLITVAFPGLDTQWSPPISIEDIGPVYFRLREPGQRGSDHLVCADIKMKDATIFINLKAADNDWPYIVENDSNYPITFQQTDAVHAEGGEQPGKQHPRYDLPDHTMTPYAWDFPAARDKKIQLRIYDSRRNVDISEIGPLMPFAFVISGGNGKKGAVSLDVRAEGSKQILRITNYNKETSVYQPKRRNTMSSTSRADTLRTDTMSSQEAFEAVTEEVPPTLAFKLDFEGIGVSLINRRLIEVVYLTVQQLKFEYTSSPVAQAVNLSVGGLQIDNQLHDGAFPVVLQPTPLSRELKNAAPLPTIQGSVIWLNDQEHGVLFVKYCSVLLQALTVEVDEDFLYALLDLSQVKGLSWEEEQEDILIEYPESIPEPEDAVSGLTYYFEVLELQPIRLALSFMRMERVSGEERLSIRNPLAIVVNALTMTIGNVNDASLEMNALAMKDVRTTLPDLQARIMYHYRQEVLRQLYRIIGSADFIGNPVGLFTNVSSGVADIFYEPFNGVVMHGNRELGVSIAKGAASFVKKTVFGFSDSMTKFTGAIGKGLSAATLDSEYQQRRRMAQRRNKPRHAIYGVAAGAEAFASSVASGVEGVVMKPLEGAENEGAFGFFKGVGKGTLSAATKPVIGVFDLVSNVSEGVRNTTTVFDSPARGRVRLPRHVPADGVLVPYSAREAKGQDWMKDLEHGAYRSESYVAHVVLPGGDNVVLLTATRVLSFWASKLKLEWDLPFSQVQGVTVEDRGIRFAHRAGRAQDRFVPLSDKKAQSWFFGEVASVVKTFNARRRIEGN